MVAPILKQGPRDYVNNIVDMFKRMVPANKAPLVAPMSAYDKMHSVFAGTYQYIDTTGRQPTPGAEAYAFAQQMLPLQDWKGTGDLVQRNMQITSPQLYVTQSTLPTGIAGIGAGQIFNGNLMDLSG